MAINTRTESVSEMLGMFSKCLQLQQFTVFTRRIRQKLYVSFCCALLKGKHENWQL